MGRLFEAVRFEIGDWQVETVRAAIAEHNLKIQVRWLSGGGDPARSCWWHITEITLDHLRPSPAWKKQMADLHLAKECEAEIKKRLKARQKKNSGKPGVPAKQLRSSKTKKSWVSWIERTTKDD
jgi:hypothetical protein